MKKIKKKVAEPSKTEKIAIDLGCGQVKVTPDFFKQNLQIEVDRVLGVDIAPCEGVDVIHDLTKYPLPFEDESIDGIFSSHFVEHLDGFQRMDFMSECYRILKPEAKMRLVHPYYKSVRAIQDPTHMFPPISENSYYYYWKEWRELNKLTHGPYKRLNCDFEFWIYYTWQDNIWANKNEESRNFAVNHYFNVVADMIVDLKKRKM